jgi:plasmid stabilization system protein ParE
MQFMRAPIAAATILAAAPALAADPSAETLKIYAGMAKLEANLVETAANVAIATLMFDTVDAYDETAEEAEEDIEAIAYYLAELRKLGLSDDQKAGLDAFEAAWTPLAAEVKTLLDAAASGTPDRAAVYAWWEKLERMDDIVDDKLTAILETHGVPYED